MGWWTNARKLYAMNYLRRSAGLSAFGAAGLVSRWANVEASGGPASINPRSGAFGIAQWLGSRLAPIRGNTNFDAQLAYVVQELNGPESRAAGVLRSAQDPGSAAVGASMFERAEGYNAGTGKDNWTAKTAAGIPGTVALLGTSAPPIGVAQNPYQLPGVNPPSLAGNGVDTGGLSSGILLLIGAALLTVYLLSD